ncbi:MAG: hypothetical protein H7837_06495 [Magnetococcus sp. MYC-9]
MTKGDSSLSLPEILSALSADAGSGKLRKGQEVDPTALILRDLERFLIERLEWRNLSFENTEEEGLRKFQKNLPKLLAQTVKTSQREFVFSISSYSGELSQYVPRNTVQESLFDHEKSDHKKIEIQNSAYQGDTPLDNTDKGIDVWSPQTVTANPTMQGSREKTVATEIEIQNSTYQGDTLLDNTDKETSHRFLQTVPVDQQRRVVDERPLVAEKYLLVNIDLSYMSNCIVSHLKIDLENKKEIFEKIKTKISKTVHQDGIVCWQINEIPLRLICIVRLGIRDGIGVLADMLNRINLDMMYFMKRELSGIYFRPIDDARCIAVVSSTNSLTMDYNIRTVLWSMEGIYSKLSDFFSGACSARNACTSKACQAYCAANETRNIILLDKSACDFFGRDVSLLCNNERWLGYDIRCVYAYTANAANSR